MSGFVNSFGVVDYVVFAGLLVVSTAIGLWFALIGGKQKTQGEYLLANRNMSTLPVAISILVSFMSAVLILGHPAEMYTQGTEFYMSVFGLMLGALMAAILFVPLLFPLKLTSSFDYLEQRFKSRYARLVGTFLMMLSQTIYMGITCYGPATALKTVTGFPLWATILSIGAVATFYSALGGIKAVIWTDVFQAVMMLAGLLAVVIQGTLKVGGASRVWSLNNRWERIQFLNFDPDPTSRHSVWSLVLGVAFFSLGNCGVLQTSVQRYSSLPTLRQARRSVLLFMAGVFVCITLACMSGLVLFAYYADKNCDPLGQRLVENANQLIIYYVMDTLGYPGVPGLFVASLLSASLSTVSSVLNALGAITWEDLLKPHIETRLSEHQKTILIKIIVVFYGLLAIGVSFLAQALQGTVVQAALSFVGSVNGPLTGMFLLGALFPCANKYGVISGALVGVGFSLWLSVGSYLHGIPLPQKPYPNGTCHVTLAAGNWSTTTVSSLVLPAVDAAVVDRGILHNFYSISYLWFSAIGIIIVIVVGLLVSYITGPSSTRDVPLKYQIPVCSRLCCCLPATWLRKFNCNRAFDEWEGPKPEIEENDIHFLDTYTWKSIHKGERTYHVTRDENNGKPLLEMNCSNGCLVGGPGSGATAVEEKTNLLLQGPATKTG